KIYRTFLSVYRCKWSPVSTQRPHWKDIVGEPKDLDGARVLASQDKYEFQKWALSMIGAQHYKGGKKGGDGGGDGFLYIKPDGKKTEKIIVSVKGGPSINP